MVLSRWLLLVTSSVAALLAVPVSTRLAAQGTEPVQVTTQGGSQPAPSRDGEWIAFRSGGMIAKIRPDGTEPTLLVAGIDPNWNRPGDLIIFGDYSLRLFTVNATTRETTHVWTGSNASTGRCDHPVWSPVADEIAVSAPALTLVHYPYGPAAPVACGCSDMQDATWSPDGQWIGFDTQDIFRVPRAGGAPEQVVGGPRSQRFPSWSPDGRFIAYSEDFVPVPPPDLGYPRNIWVVDARGEAFGKTQVTFGNFNDAYPAWSPDGGTIYFDSDRSGRTEIWKVAFDSVVPVRASTWGRLKTLYR